MSDQVLERPVEILLVDDNYADIRLVQEGFKEDNMVPYNLHIAKDGIEALEFLHQEGKFNEAPRPDIILLDLNMPRKGGREVIEDIKNTPELKYIPIIVLTSNERDADILNLYELGANSYIVKPVDSDKFIQVIKSLKQWFSIIRLPKKGLVKIDQL
jgi:CheY-like chemotaxis protein